MNALLSFYKSSIGKKLLVGLTGLLLCTYLVVHLIGNLLMFRSDHGAAFDAYAEILPSILIINIIEYLLLAVFLLHIFTGTLLWFLNRGARPVRYEKNRQEDNSALTSRTMFLTGSIVFIFLVIHLRNFWYASRVEAGEGFSMYAVVRSTFSDPIYGGLYLVAMALLGFHLRHGFQSAFQTFGLRNRKFSAFIEWVGAIFWLLIPLGFASMPLYFLLYH